MTLKFSFLVFSTLILLLNAAASHAEENRFQHNVHAFAQYVDAHFVELDDDGEPYNEEDGSLIFTGVGSYWQFDSGLFTELVLKAAEDTLTYRGLSQFGRFIESETEYFIRDAHLLLGRSFGPTGAYLGLGNRFRERNILGREGVRGLYEEMDVTYGLFGLRATIFANRPFQIRLDGNISTDIDAELKVASEDFDSAKVQTGKQFAVEGSIEFLFVLFDGFTLSIIPSYNYTHIDKSDEFAVYQGDTFKGNIFLPETEYETLSLSAQLSWFF